MFTIFQTCARNQFIVFIIRSFYIEYRFSGWATKQKQKKHFLQKQNAVMLQAKTHFGTVSISTQVSSKEARVEHRPYFHFSVLNVHTNKARSRLKCSFLTLQKIRLNNSVALALCFYSFGFLS